MGSSGSKSGAGGASIASIGLQYYASLQKGAADMYKAEGESNADTFQAERLDVAAQYGGLKATQTSGQMTRNLNTTLGNIAAVRAAANTDPNSPTGAAVSGNVEAIGNSQRSITVGNITAQTDQDVSDAAYYRTLSSNALVSGGMAQGADDLNAAATAFTSLNKLG